MNSTTKRFSRTLGQAFKGVDYASALELPASNTVDKWIGRFCAAGLFSGLLMLIKGWI
jgi:hypothetical protein